LKPDLAVKGP